MTVIGNVGFLLLLEKAHPARTRFVVSSLRYPGTLNVAGDYFIYSVGFNGGPF